MEKTLEIKRRAQKYLQAGDLDGAVGEYERLLGADETDPYLFVTLGDLLFKKGRREDAGRRYREAAQAYERAGLIKNAIAVCKKMLRLGVDLSDTTRTLGELHAQDGLSSEATVYFVQYAEHCLSLDQRREAAEALERAATLSPDDPSFSERLGELWGLEGESLRGAQALLRAAQLRERLGQGDEARRLRDRAEKMHPDAEAALAREAQARNGTVSEPLGASIESPTMPPSTNGRSGDVEVRTTFVPPSSASLQREESLAPTRHDEPAPPAHEPPAAPQPQPDPAHDGLPGSVSLRLARAREMLASGERELAAEELLAAAQAWEAEGGLEQASTIYHELSKSPQATERLYRLWLANCEKRQQWKEASMVCCELGDLALAAQEPAAAHEWFVSARSYDPDNERAARRLERLKEWDERPDTPPPGGDRITVKRRMPEDFDVDLNELVHAFQEAVQHQMNPDDARSRFDLGMTYRQMGLLDEAVAEFRLASRNADLRVMAVDMLGRALLERGDFGAAIAELERALAQEELPLEAEINFRYNLGLALEASGRIVEALAQFERVFASEPNYPDVALKIRELRR